MPFVCEYCNLDSSGIRTRPWMLRIDQKRPTTQSSKNCFSYDFIPPFRDPLKKAQYDKDDGKRILLQCETGA